nr:ROK family transcriptional regulator [Microlunatus antarcticus]
MGRPVPRVSFRKDERVASQYRGVTALETHAAILDLIRSSGVVSRTELVDRSGLTGATITRIIRQLMQDGLVVETGQAESTGGKPRTLIQLNAAARAAVGISVEDLGITYVVVDLNGKVIERRTTKGSGGRRPITVTQQMAEETRLLLSGAGIDSGDLLGVGVAVKGRQDSPYRKLRADPDAAQWEQFDLEHTLGSALATSVIVDNDSICAAVGEFWIGRRPPTDNVATVYMTDGFGLGLMIRGDVYRGASGNAGQISHVLVDPDGPQCECGRHGCLNAMAGAVRIVELARGDTDLRASLRLGRTGATVRRDHEKVAAAAAREHPAARRLIDASAQHLASVLVSLTNLMDLHSIVLAGPGFAGVGEIYVDTAAEQLRRFSYVGLVHATEVTLSETGPDSAALGAASLVLRSRLGPSRS